VAVAAQEQAAMPIVESKLTGILPKLKPGIGLLAMSA